MDQWTTHAGGVCELRHHFVWCPKYRRPVLTGEIAPRLDTVLRAVSTAVIARDIADQKGR